MTFISNLIDRYIHIRYMWFLTERPAPKSYWPYALEYCGLEGEVLTPSRYRLIDHYWRSIRGMLDCDGKPKYVQLFQFAKCVFSFSHGNVVPEWGFSINKKLLDAHGSSIQEETIVAISRDLLIIYIITTSYCKLL